MSYSILDARRPTGHGGHRVRHLVATMVSRAVPDGRTADDAKPTLVELAWGAAGAGLALALCRLINLVA